MAQSMTLPFAGTAQVTSRANLRQGGAQLIAPVQRKLNPGDMLQVLGIVIGQEVQGNAHWYSVPDNGFVWSGACGPLIPSGVASPPPTPVLPAPNIDGFGLDPAFAGKLTTLLQACRDKGFEFRISQGLRSPEIQARYYCQWDKHTPVQIDVHIAALQASGAPWTAQLLSAYRDIPRTPEWLTGALPGAGWHQWGEAADCYCHRQGHIVLDGSDPCYETYATLAEGLGLTAGLRFHHQDAGHVQLRSAGGATDIFPWSYIDAQMRTRFGDKPALVGG